MTMDDPVTQRLAVLGRQRIRNMERANRIQAAIAHQTRAAKDAGLSAPAIARELGISHQAVYDILKKGTQ